MGNWPCRLAKHRHKLFCPCVATSFMEMTITQSYHFALFPATISALQRFYFNFVCPSLSLMYVVCLQVSVIGPSQNMDSPIWSNMVQYGPI